VTDLVYLPYAFFFKRKMWKMNYTVTMIEIVPLTAQQHSCLKAQFTPWHATGGTEVGIEVTAPLILNFGARLWWVVNAAPQPHYPRERVPVPIVQEAGWALGPVWTSKEKSKFLIPQWGLNPGPISPRESTFLYNTSYYFIL
jgi:hypothetical protein